MARDSQVWGMIGLRTTLLVALSMAAIVAAPACSRSGISGDEFPRMRIAAMYVTAVSTGDSELLAETIPARDYAGASTDIEDINDHLQYEARSFDLRERRDGVLDVHILAERYGRVRIDEHALLKLADSDSGQDCGVKWTLADGTEVMLELARSAGGWEVIAVGQVGSAAYFLENAPKE